MVVTNEILLTTESTFKHKVSSTLNRSAEFGSKVIITILMITEIVAMVINPLSILTGHIHLLVSKFKLHF
jgi:hypothetical protein